jgi:[ribosomal protein S5]-alanine N-acetyltransferase
MRQITHSDSDELATMLKDGDLMSAWGHTFDDDQINAWIDNQIRRYSEDGIGFLIAIDKDANEVVGQIGLLLQTINDQKYWDIGYILKKAQRGRGYAQKE